MRWIRPEDQGDPQRLTATLSLGSHYPAAQDDALCAQTDPDAFFPETGQHNVVTQAKAICAMCPVRAWCLMVSLETGETVGVQGGKSERERRRIRKEHPALDPARQEVAA